MSNTESTVAASAPAAAGDTAESGVLSNTLESAGPLAGVMLCIAAGSLSMGLAPFIVSTLSTHAGLSTTQAGLCVSAEMASSVLSAAVLLVLPRRVPFRALAVVALVAVIAGNLLCVTVSGFPGYAAARFIAGIGCGLTIAAYGLIGASRSPERKFAVLNVVNIALAAACGAAVPWFSALGGTNTLFLLIAVVSCGALIAAGLIPDHLMCVAAASHSRGRTPLARRAAAVIGSLMNLFYFSALGAVWAYLSDIEVALGGGLKTIDATISLGYMVAGIAGSLIASAAAPRLEHRQVIALSAIGSAAAVESIVSLPGIYVFVLAVPVFIFLWFLVYPFLMGILSEIDRSGRLVVLNVLIQIMGFVVGPALGGPLVRLHRYGAFGYACAIGFLAALACALAIRPLSSMTKTKNWGD